uniref:Uncharacterized protein n=1 Tax=Eutreptiella gymnastica TaxID=73025 RepID=A0A7S4CY52_9EUGL
MAPELARQSTPGAVCFFSWMIKFDPMQLASLPHCCIATLTLIPKASMAQTAKAPQKPRSKAACQTALSQVTTRRSRRSVFGAISAPLYYATPGWCALCMKVLPLRWIAGIVSSPLAYFVSSNEACFSL